MPQSLTIALVAGEASGDTLGAGLMQALNTAHPNIRWLGVGGPKMIQQGLQSAFPMEELSIMGLFEVLKHYRHLSKRRTQLIQDLIDQKPDVFIGIDAPDFNLTIEEQLKSAGIPTVHYVSPSVWAWREKRLEKIKRSVNHMLTLFPFEEQYYQKQDIPVTCVGHTLADALPFEPNVEQAKKTLDLNQNEPVLAVLPGSRRSEVARLMPVFIETCEQVLAHQPKMQFICPAANPQRYTEIQSQLTQASDSLKAAFHLCQGQAHEAMESADVILIASGTATLEAALLKKPMVVAYKMNGLTYAILSRLIRVPYVALPNLLMNEEVMPECIQQKANADHLAEKVNDWLANSEKIEALQTRLLALHKDLARNANETASRAVLKVIDDSRN